MAIATSATNGTLPAALADSTRESVINTFAAITGEEPVYQGEGDEGILCDGVVGIISLVGDVTWSLMLGIPRETAPPLTERFAGFEIEFDSPDMGDAVGELANVLAGDVSARFEQLGARANLSLPTIVRGSDVEMLLPGCQSSFRMRFACEDGPFWLKIATS